MMEEKNYVKSWSNWMRWNGKGPYQKTDKQNSGSRSSSSFRCVWRKRKTGSWNLWCKSLHRCKWIDSWPGSRCGIYCFSWICTCRFPACSNQSWKTNFLWKTVMYHRWGLFESSKCRSRIWKTFNSAWIYETLWQRLHAGKRSTGNRRIWRTINASLYTQKSGGWNKLQYTDGSSWYSNSRNRCTSLVSRWWIWIRSGDYAKSNKIFSFWIKGPTDYAASYQKRCLHWCWSLCKLQIWIRH